MSVNKIPMVMIHGMFCGGWCWENYRDYFTSRGYHCITPTLRFHDTDKGSYSPHPDLGTTGLLDYCSDLEQEILNLQEKPVLVGHSMGGLLAQILAGRGLARSVVLLATAPPAGIFPFTPDVLRSSIRFLLKWKFWSKPHCLEFDGAVFSMLNRLSSEQQMEIFRRFTWESGRAAAEIGFWFFDRKKAATVDPSKIRAPVLVISGTEDRICPSSVVRKVAARFSDVSIYREFEGHGHWLIGEPGWEEIAGYIHEWIQENQNS